MSHIKKFGLTIIAALSYLPGFERMVNLIDGELRYRQLRNTFIENGNNSQYDGNLRRRIVDRFELIDNKIISAVKKIRCRPLHIPAESV